MKDMKVMKKGFDDLSYAAIGAAIEVLKHGIKNFVLKKTFMYFMPFMVDHTMHESNSFTGIGPKFRCTSNAQPIT